MRKTEPRFPNKLLISGIMLIIAGGIVLLWTLGLFPEFLLWLIALWPVPLLVAGLVMLYLVYLQGKSHQWLLPGMILLLCGIFFLLYNSVIPEKSFERIWPAFLTIAGLALLPYGFKASRKARPGILISSATLAALSVIFFPFSLKLITTDFSLFAIRWWPAIIIITGIILLISFQVNKRRHASRGNKKADGLRKPGKSSPKQTASPGKKEISSATKPVPKKKVPSPKGTSSPRTKTSTRRSTETGKGRRTDITRA